jgi:hypothetical protein
MQPVQEEVGIFFSFFSNYYYSGVFTAKSRFNLNTWMERKST